MVRVRLRFRSLNFDIYYNIIDKELFDQAMVKTATSKTTISRTTIKAHKDARTRRTVRLTWTTRSGNSSTNVWEARLKNHDFGLPHFDFDPLFFKT